MITWMRPTAVRRSNHSIRLTEPSTPFKPILVTM